MTPSYIPSIPTRITIELVATVAFYVMFGGAHYLVTYFPIVDPIVLPLESWWPLVPSLSPIYLSVTLILAALPFMLQTAGELLFAAVLLGIQLLISFLFFVLCPLAPLPPLEETAGAWNIFLILLDVLNLDYNLFPSLHVAFALSCAYLLGRPERLLLNAMWWGWAGAVSVSTLLLHQHYTIDLVGGALVMSGSVAITKKLLASSLLDPMLAI